MATCSVAHDKNIVNMLTFSVIFISVRQVQESHMYFSWDIVYQSSNPVEYGSINHMELLTMHDITTHWRSIYHFGEIFVTGYIRSCQNDNFQYHLTKMLSVCQHFSFSATVLEYMKAICMFYGIYSTSEAVPAWMNNYIHYKMWDEITYSFPNFNGAAIEVCEWISNFIPHFTVHVITYSC